MGYREDVKSFGTTGTSAAGPADFAAMSQRVSSVAGTGRLR
jgi:hypothetical protein